MKIILVSNCSLDIEQYVKSKMSVLVSASKSLISSRWVTYMLITPNKIYTKAPHLLGWVTIFFFKFNLNSGMEKQYLQNTLCIEMLFPL